MKKLMVLIAVAMTAVWSACCAERITVDEVVSHYPWDGKVDCVCTLSGLDGVYNYKGAFTLSVKKDGATIRRVITNDLATADGTYTNTFDCASLFGEGIYPNGGIVVDLVRRSMPTVDAIGIPIGIVGDVLVIDVSAGSEALSYPTTELTGVDIGTFNCDVYKTDKIVLKKVPAGSYFCEPRGYDVAEAVATQKLTTKGFYIGVFPITQRQYERVMGSNPSYFTTDATGNAAAQRPVESVLWATIRGSVGAGDGIMVSSADSFLKRLVAKTGLSGFDLPTEAQWEMAARAGSAAAYGAYWDGNSAVEMTVENFGDAVWYSKNASGTTHAVGDKYPNSWGLFDMLGNTSECCRDIYINLYRTEYVDVPCTDVSYEQGVYCVCRGGAHGGSMHFCCPSFRNNGYKDYSYGHGFRLSRALP